ncbi:MAG: Uncharacterized protein XD91_0481 [Clostridiales bacterium 38_11]|nr:MAG: Uncharacterized protein XD91_0481 [Clostridiales bacterium 38_11]HBH13630.1 hypothetical protein [Clostridiales bacterium]
MFLYAVIIGLIIGKLRKGKLEKIGYLTIQYPLLIVIGILFQLFVFILNIGLSDLGNNIRDGILIASYILIMSGILSNRSIKFMLLFFVGAAYNFIILILNGVKVGITATTAGKAFGPEILELISTGYVRYFTIIPESKFYMGAFLSLEGIFIYPIVLTIGDIILFFATVIFIQYAMTDRSIRKGSHIRYSRNLFR